MSLEVRDDGLVRLLAYNMPIRNPAAPPIRRNINIRIGCSSLVPLMQNQVTVPRIKVYLIQEAKVGKRLFLPGNGTGTKDQA